ncbi:putative fucosyltransferase 10 [Miscanthus floridulus]|uniref:putative fucosyltransferase 10 n=1 Tax=Miscanthus floridulus TaxID=154761 RepID=UPI00345A2220
MDSAKATKGERDLPETEKRRPTGLGTVTAVFLLSLPLLILFFLFGDRAVASIAGDSLVWQRTGVQSSGNASSSPVNAHHDLLLGGLLSPDFDAATCLSRFEASKRWKTPPPFPVSPYLVHKLRQYESNHRRCGPGTANYREAMAQLTSGRNGDRAECRYVVWFPIQGLGNRMLSVVSTFLYALLTGRVLLVHEPPEMEGLFCEPFPGTSWILPPDFPCKDGFWVGSNDSYLRMLENNVVRYDGGGGGDASALPPYVYFHLEQTQLRLQNHTFCEEDHRVLDRFNWMVLRSDSYFAVALFLMPMYRAELDLMFPAKASVFHHLGRYLLHPGNRAWGIVERFYDGYLAGADERLGIQVRLAPFLPLTFEIMYEQIIRCTREHDLLPQVTDTSEPGARPSKGTAAKVKAVLVVSLKPEYYDKLHSVYYTNATATGEVVTVYQPSHDQDQHSEARAHNERALAEIFLLSYSDRLVTTGFSTFGYVAHSLAGQRPWLLMLPDRTTKRAAVACVRPSSVEPCLHSPPSLVCRAAQDLDPVAHLPFMRHCEDVDAGGGLKLFD